MKCVRCGSDVDGAYSFCNNCNAPIRRFGTSNISIDFPKLTPKQKKRQWISVLLAILSFPLSFLLALYGQPGFIRSIQGSDFLFLWPGYIIVLLVAAYLYTTHRCNKDVLGCRESIKNLPYTNEDLMELNGIDGYLRTGYYILKMKFDGMVEEYPHRSKYLKKAISCLRLKENVTEEMIDEYVKKVPATEFILRYLLEKKENAEAVVSEPADEDVPELDIDPDVTMANVIHYHPIYSRTSRSSMHKHLYEDNPDYTPPKEYIGDHTTDAAKTYFNAIEYIIADMKFCISAAGFLAYLPGVIKLFLGILRGKDVILLGLELMMFALILFFVILIVKYKIAAKILELVDEHWLSEINMMNKATEDASREQVLRAFASQNINTDAKFMKNIIMGVISSQGNHLYEITTLTKLYREKHPNGDYDGGGCGGGGGGGCGGCGGCGGGCGGCGD